MCLILLLLRSRRICLYLFFSMKHISTKDSVVFLTIPVDKKKISRGNYKQTKIIPQT